MNIKNVGTPGEQGRASVNVCEQYQAGNESNYLPADYPASGSASGRDERGTGGKILIVVWEETGNLCRNIDIRGEEGMNAARLPFNIMAFPGGPLCNLDCEYCYYLAKRKLYPGEKQFRMSDDLLEEYIRQYIESQPGPVINFGWQGGEPTLRGLAFFERVVELQQRYLPEGWQSLNNFQTNGSLLNDDWGRFLSENNFLVGLSIDGPAWLHDTYRKDKKGAGTLQKVMAGLGILQQHGVDFNVLCVLNDLNSAHPRELYNFFSENRIEFIQFIPLVERLPGGEVSQRSVKPGAYASFLISFFNRWLQDGYGEVFIQIFEEAVSARIGRKPGLCIFSKRCGLAPVMEFNGDLYSCDHFVSPENRLGNIRETSILEMVGSEKQAGFGQLKEDFLPEQCRNCDLRSICNGGCPKNRFLSTARGEPGLNYLCQDYQQFFRYIAPYLKEIAGGIKDRQQPKIIQQKLQKLYNFSWLNAGRNDPCPCGSGKKYKKCCLNKFQG